MYHSHTKSGFSLVELSIVLVILGLLVGGILGGQSLIRAAELRNVQTEYQQFQAAVLMFTQQYQAKPGDMPNATRFWGNAETGGIGGECTTPLTAEGTGTQTCNGNGDGIVQAHDSAHERFRFWQHLANAGLITGPYSGVVDGTNTRHHVIGKNCPASRLSGLGWSLRHAPGESTAGWAVADNRWQVAWLGTQTASVETYGDAFTAEELWSIDSKMDDGRPASGILRVRMCCNGCTTAATRDQHATAEYAFDGTAKCSATFYNMY